MIFIGNLILRTMAFKIFNITSNLKSFKKVISAGLYGALKSKVTFYKPENRFVVIFEPIYRQNH